jgi:hypothetical protein
MHLLYPLSLLALPPVLGVIVLMYILKLRRKDVVVSSTFLWRQVIRDVQANAPFQKLRKNLLLLLQLIAATLLILALARPIVRSYGRSGRNIVVVVDTGVSMRATDVAPTRLDAAKRRAHELVDSMRSNDMMMVLSAASRPEVGRTGFTTERGELHRAIDSLQPHDTPTNMREALNLASDLVASRNSGDSGEIDLVSDGVFAGANGSGGEGAALAGLNLGKTHVVFHPVGVGHDNVGIVAVDLRRNLGAEKTVQLLVVTHNFSDHDHKFVEEIYDGEDLREAHEVDLAPGGESTEPYDLAEPDSPQRLRIHLDAKDDLPADNDAALILKPRRTIKALLVGSDNLFLENALRVDPGVELEQTSLYPGAEAAKSYDVVLFYNSAPDKLPPGNYFFIHCVSDQCPARVTGTQQNVSPADWERNDPVLRYVDLTNERFVEALQASPLEWGREIAVADSGSLVVAGEKEKMRALFAAFDPIQSPHFPLDVAFPIFISNSVRWLGTGEDDSELNQIHTGDPITIPAPPNAGVLTVTRPDGSTRQVPVAEHGGAVFDGADQIGIYTAKGVNFTYPFAANLASASASDIRPNRTLSLLTGNAPAGTHRVPDDDHGLLLRIVVLLLLALLVGEWYAFHRRVFAA